MCEWLSCGDWCDVRLMCGGRSFNAHRAVLASVSNFLRRMLMSCPVDESPVFIFLPEFDYDAMSSILYYIYNGEVLIPNNKLKTFLDTANAMEIFIDQQYTPLRKDLTQDCSELSRVNGIFAMVNYKICQLRLCNGKNGCFINIRKVLGGTLGVKAQEQVSSLNIPESSVQTFRCSEENISGLRNLTSTSRYRQRQSFLRDIIIETYRENGNVNGQTPGVPAISNEEYRELKSVPSIFEAETSKMISTSNSKKPSLLNYLEQDNYKESNKGGQSSLLNFDLTKDSHSKCLRDVPKKCENDVKSKYTHFASSNTAAKITILNKVLQSPWQPRQPISYTPFPKKVFDFIHSENSHENKVSVNSMDKNNNTDTCQLNVHDKILVSVKQDLKCTICHKVFTERQDYNIHMKTHSSPTRYSCGECQKMFSQLRNFKYHMSVHRGTKEFAATCSVCGKHFNDKGYLSNHMKIHRNRKEYKCASCPKSFNQRVAFNMHVRIHTGVKPHVCEECGKAFSRKMLLKQHQRTHSGERPYACAYCDKRFADRSNMTLHLRLHTGVKPFSCNMCQKSFTKKHHLKSHLNFHTGAKPYSCPRCKLAFTQSSNMRTHLKKCNASN